MREININCSQYQRQGFHDDTPDATETERKIPLRLKRAGVSIKLMGACKGLLRIK